LNWTCYYDQSDVNVKYHLYPTNAEKNAVIGTTIAVCISALIFFSVCLFACRLCRKAFQLKSRTKFYNPPVVDRILTMKMKKKKERKLTFEAKVAMHLILRFSRILLTPLEMEKRKNRTKNLLVHVIIRSVCQNLGDLNAISISDIIEYGSNRLSLHLTHESDKELLKIFILDLIEKAHKKLIQKQNPNLIESMEIVETNGINSDSDSSD